MTQRGSLLVVSGFSGVGKGTVMQAILDAYEGYALSVSCTTRKAREGEVDGKSYFFIDQQAFEAMIREDALIEHACYCGNYYGTPRRYVEERLAEGTDVILEIEIQGAMQIRSQYPDAVLVFLMPPSASELLARLSGRGTEEADVIRQRLQRALEEAEGIEQYDYVFINDVPQECASRIHGLVQAQRSLTGRNQDLIRRVREDLKHAVSQG